MRVVRIATVVVTLIFVAVGILIYLSADSNEPEPYVRERAIDSGWAACSEAGGVGRVDKERKEDRHLRLFPWFCDIRPWEYDFIKGPEDFWIDDPPAVLPE